MSLKTQLDADLKTAMLARDSFLSDVLKGIKSAILNQEIASGKRDEGLGDAEIESLIAKEAKKRDEAANLYDQGGNVEMAKKERAEKEIIAKYLPKQLSEDDIKQLVIDAIASTGATEVKDLGKVIGQVKSKAGNSADGALVAKIAKDQLN
ncbi:MAG: GatB/YqeY domain-containing protein [Candidatus Saccharibacteria bacterium]|nr:GatB/YqeY domain-containing protein [Candidatus Saccharibacteria bacterium]